MNPIASLSCLDSSVDLQVRSEMFADLYHLTLRNHPSSLDRFILRWRPPSRFFLAPRWSPSSRASLFIRIFRDLFSLFFFPTASFAGRGSQVNLRGTHHRVISSHLMPSARAVSHQLVGGRRSSHGISI